SEEVRAADEAERCHRERDANPEGQGPRQHVWHVRRHAEGEQPTADDEESLLAAAIDHGHSSGPAVSMRSTSSRKRASRRAISKWGAILYEQQSVARSSYAWRYHCIEAPISPR